MSAKNTYPITTTSSADMARNFREALLTDPVSRGEHSSEYLKQIRSTPFGAYNKKVTYTSGCIPSKEFAGGAGGLEPVSAIVLNIQKPDGLAQAVMIGRTPDEFNPSKPGGQLIADAGMPGDILLYAKSADGNESYRYMDEAEIQGVRAVNGSTDLTFKPSEARVRQTVITGEIMGSIGLIDTQQETTIT
jgi:hypothetical protein